MAINYRFLFGCLFTKILLWTPTSYSEVEREKNCLAVVSAQVHSIFRFNPFILERGTLPEHRDDGWVKMAERHFAPKGQSIIGQRVMVQYGPNELDRPGIVLGGGWLLGIAVYDLLSQRTLHLNYEENKYRERVSVVPEKLTFMENKLEGKLVKLNRAAVTPGSEISLEVFEKGLLEALGEENSRAALLDFVVTLPKGALENNEEIIERWFLFGKVSRQDDMQGGFALKVETQDKTYIIDVDYVRTANVHFFYPDDSFPLSLLNNVSASSPNLMYMEE